MRQDFIVRAEFKMIFAELSDVIYRLCFYKTSSKATAEDLTQEVFVRLWKVMKEGKKIDKPKSYVYQIARNLIIDYYRTQKDISLDLLKEQGIDFPSTNQASADTKAEISIIKKAIDSLTENYRDVLYLKLIEELSTKEIANILNISENVVSVRINRGKEKLRKIFTVDIA